MWTAELKGTRVKYDGFKTSILEQSKKIWIKDPNTSILCNLNLGSRLESYMNVGFVLSGYTETRIKMLLSSNYKQNTKKQEQLGLGDNMMSNQLEFTLNRGEPQIAEIVTDGFEQT